MKLRILVNKVSRNNNVIANRMVTIITIFVELSVSLAEGNSTSLISVPMLLKKLIDFLTISFILVCLNTEPRGFEPLPTVLETVMLPLTPWLFI